MAKRGGNDTVPGGVVQCWSSRCDLKRESSKVSFSRTPSTTC